MWNRDFFVCMLVEEMSLRNEKVSHCWRNISLSKRRKAWWSFQQYKHGTMPYRICQNNSFPPSAKINPKILFVTCIFHSQLQLRWCIIFQYSFHNFGCHLFHFLFFAFACVQRIFINRWTKRTTYNENPNVMDSFIQLADSRFFSLLCLYWVRMLAFHENWYVSSSGVNAEH